MKETYRGKRAARYSQGSVRSLILFALSLVLTLGVSVYLILHALPKKGEQPETTVQQEQPAQNVQEETPAETQTTQQSGDTAPQETDAQQPEQTTAPVVEEQEEYASDISVHAVSGTEPSDLVSFTEVLAGGNITSSYQMPQPISFDVGSKYTDLDGIFAFRGNNFRSGSSFGTADLSQKSFGSYWTQSISSLVAPDGNSWSGCGWTGQPLIVNWPKSTRQIMNLYDWAKEADELIEVIYATMDGHIYFLELGTGKATRDALDMGFTFKGSGSIDPRGYPVLYVGAGYQSMKGEPRAFAISLIDFSILFEFGNDDSFALRSWYCFDASPLVDAETDQLIYPGESGVLYLIHLNTQYDEQAGTLTMNPETVRWHYQGVRSSTQSYWLGVESSPVIFEGHMIMADNGGLLMCLNLDTLELEWVQDVVDDTNASPVLELEDGHPYVYIAPSFHLGWRSDYTADIPVFKINAETGEIVWKVSYECYSVSGVSGGMQGTMALGKKNLSELVFAPIARTGDSEGGILAALDKKTGEKVWELKTESYSWASPTIVYDQNGDGYLLFATLLGDLMMVDGKTGEVLDTMNLDAHVESTVAVYDNTAIIGTRTNYIYGITLE